MEKQPESLKEKPRGSSSIIKKAKLLECYSDLEAFDRLFVGQQTNYLAGVDEAGRGALAGPVVAAAVVLPPVPALIGVNDSKKLSESERETLYTEIIDRAISIGVALGTPRRIDRDNILNATLFTMGKAVNNLSVTPDIVLIDGRDKINISTRVVAIPGGDAKSLSIAAASIVAKVTRDRMMQKLHNRYPVYNFTRNKGYGTKEHLEAISKYGIIPQHRKSFRLKGIEKKAEMF